MSQYQQLCDAYVEMLASDPKTCVELGLNKKLNGLPDPSLEALALRQPALRPGELRQN